MFQAAFLSFQKNSRLRRFRLWAKSQNRYCFVGGSLSCVHSFIGFVVFDMSVLKKRNARCFRYYPDFFRCK
ncbi:hypothetical protein GCWU000324_00294 [Kingella oralis ATCC 51147]|uniref:Uncharacterized protein n=1 Tax=Kingella oralis ATCC 51147 TaxID=629741 RepID=C4GHG1_9NEIS|nr:hypothetical protein GCWU000324_00294 [Kingella oralis ATCC 51147]